MGDELAGFVNGSTVVEIIFGWPGIGKLLIDAINARDLPVVTAAVFVIALMVMVINLPYSLTVMKINYLCRKAQIFLT